MKFTVDFENGDKYIIKVAAIEELEDAMTRKFGHNFDNLNVYFDDEEEGWSVLDFDDISILSDRKSNRLKASFRDLSENDNNSYGKMDASNISNFSNMDISIVSNGEDTIPGNPEEAIPEGRENSEVIVPDQETNRTPTKK